MLTLHRHKKHPEVHWAGFSLAVAVWNPKWGFSPWQRWFQFLADQVCACAVTEGFQTSTTNGPTQTDPNRKGSVDVHDLVAIYSVSLSIPTTADEPFWYESISTKKNNSIPWPISDITSANRIPSKCLKKPLLEQQIKTTYIFRCQAKTVRCLFVSHPCRSRLDVNEASVRLGLDLWWSKLALRSSLWFSSWWSWSHHHDGFTGIIHNPSTWQTQIIPEIPCN